APELLSTTAEQVRAQPASLRGDLLFYLSRIAGLPPARFLELERWGQDGEGGFPGWPEGAEGFEGRLGQARSSWARLEARYPDGPLMDRLEVERRQLELRIRLLALREAAGAASGLTRRQVHAAVTEGDGAGLLEVLAGRWGVAGGEDSLDLLRRFLSRTRPPSDVQEEWFTVAGELLRHIEERAPADLAGVRRKLVREVHGNWRPEVARELEWELVDLVSQDPDSYPGLEAEEEHVRRYQGALDPHLLGFLRQPGANELEDYQLLAEERRVLARKLDRTAEDQVALAEVDRLLLRGVRRPDDSVAVQGVEWACDETLQGRRGLLRRLRWDEEEPLELEFLPPVNGGDVRLALRESWSQAALLAIEEGYGLALQALPSKPGGAAMVRRAQRLLARPRAGLVLLDLRDGSVPVAVTTPSYDPESFRQDLARLESDPDCPLRHRALGSAASGEQIPYPGSTFKLVAALEALSRDLGWWERSFTCERTYLPPYGNGLALSCTGLHGEIDLRGAIRESCNIYFYHLAEELGFDALAERAAALGFGQRTTGLDLTSLPGEDGTPVPAGHLLEVGSRLHEADSRGRGRAINAMRLSIGQTYVEASPLQMARFFGWLACGKLWRPRMILERDGVLTEPAWEQPPIDPAVQALLLEAMLEVTGPEGTAYDRVFGSHQLSDFRVAGKTGTAQIGRGGDGREFPTHAWFVGFFPAAGAGQAPVEPRYAVAVLCENTDLHGGWIANYVLYQFLDKVGEELLR
ncbi:MAG: hypothetical protein H8E31_02005, partial [Planctomycetes bacterium]|nr:hypothetical protein [Planctomycetota bacterium]